MVTSPPFSCPTVSIIIPLYNAEKYIAECLESLLVQTFQNFEVIIVDDCSTDSSCAIVESYAKKFGGRLTFSRMSKNTGSGALPRNKGLMLSRGEYVFLMDADDTLTKTALEELYALAKNFDSDVVYCEKYFMTDEDGTNSREKTAQHSEPGFVDKPTFDPEDPTQRIQIMLRDGYIAAPWSKLIRRSLLIEQEIFFPHCIIAEDTVWTLILVFYAKKFLRVPNIIYFYRSSVGSAMRKTRSPQQLVNFYFEPLLLGLKTLDEKLDEQKFFRQNPAQRYIVLEYYFRGLMYSFFEASFQLQAFDIYEAIKQNFGDKMGDYDVLIPMLASSLNHMQKIFAIKRREFDQLAAQAQEQVNRFNQFAAQSQEQVKRFNEFAEAANNRIAQLEAELQRLKS